MASVTFLGAEPIDVLRFGPDVRPGLKGVYHHVSLGCSRHPMVDPTDLMADPHQGPRAEVMVSLRGPTPTGLSRSIAVLAAAPAVEGLVLVADALIDLEAPLWTSSPFTAMLLAPSDVEAVDAAPAGRSGDAVGGDADHSDRGRVGATQGRRRDAGGVAYRRRRRARSPASGRSTEVNLPPQPRQFAWGMAGFAAAALSLRRERWSTPAVVRAPDDATCRWCVVRFAFGRSEAAPG